MSLRDFIKKKDSKKLSTYSDEDLQQELWRRETNDNPFPLDVFADELSPFITAMVDKYDIPEPFIGLALLSAYSTAIGTAYTVGTNMKDRIFLSIWGCLLGVTSSGKSLAIDKIYEPLFNIQNDYDFEWEETTARLSAEKISQSRLKTVIFRDAHIPTLVRYVLPDNPKGLVKWSDELLEWINGLNQLSRKEGTDEQFWISSWNCKNFSGIRSGKQKFVNKRPFVNVIGGTQYTLVPRFFAKDRDTTGFIFRMLIAKHHVDKIATPDPLFEMPTEFYSFHEQALQRLYHGLPVESAEDEPRKCIISRNAAQIYMRWYKDIERSINLIPDRDQRDIEGGTLGKIKEYALRFSAILHLMDKALSPRWQPLHPDFGFRQEELIGEEVITRAIKLANYFYESMRQTYELAQITTTAPTDVLMAAALLKHGKTVAEIGRTLYPKSKPEAARKMMTRNLNKWVKEYPKVFNSTAR